jgi:hypothetical protein
LDNSGTIKLLNMNDLIGGGTKWVQN